MEAILGACDQPTVLRIADRMVDLAHAVTAQKQHSSDDDGITDVAVQAEAQHSLASGGAEGSGGDEREVHGMHPSG